MFSWRLRPWHDSPFRREWCSDSLSLDWGSHGLMSLLPALVLITLCVVENTWCIAPFVIAESAFCRIEMEASQTRRLYLAATPMSEGG